MVEMYEEIDEDYIKFLEFKMKIVKAVNNSRSEDLEDNLQKIGFVKIFQLKSLNYFLSDDTNIILVLKEGISWRLYEKAIGSPIKQRKSNPPYFGDQIKKEYVYDVKEKLIDFIEKDGKLTENKMDFINSEVFELNVLKTTIGSKPDELEDHFYKLGFVKVLEQETEKWYFTKDSNFIIVLADDGDWHLYSRSPSI
ncbi:MAG: hypothetical protein ACP5C3_07195 [Methanomicrobiales archaeon]